MKKELEKCYQSYCQNLEESEGLSKKDLNDSYVISGAVWKFSMTFHIACIIMKDILCDYHGILESAADSTKEILLTAYSVNLINDDEIWMNMLEVRDNLAGEYDGVLAKKAVYDIRDRYIPVFEHFRNTVSELLQTMKQEDQKTDE